FTLSHAVLGSHGYAQLVEEQALTVAAVFDRATGPDPVSLRQVIRTVHTWKAGYLHLVPASLDLAWALRAASEQPQVLRDQLQAVQSDYDLIILDCAPTDSLLTTAAYLAAAYVFIPVRPAELSTLGLPLVRRSLQAFETTYPPEAWPQIGGIIFTGREE